MVWVKRFCCPGHRHAGHAGLVVVRNGMPFTTLGFKDSTPCILTHTERSAQKTNTRQLTPAGVRSFRLSESYRIPDLSQTFV